MKLWGKTSNAARKIFGSLNNKHYCVLVHDIFLSNSSVPHKGVLQSAIGGKTTEVCGESLNEGKADIVCRHLGYKEAYSFASIPFREGARPASISYLHCGSHKIYLSQCEFTITASINCPGSAYIQCKYE